MNTSNFNDLFPQLNDLTKSIRTNKKINKKLSGILCGASVQTVCFLVAENPINKQTYLKDRFAKRIMHAATLRQKLRGDAWCNG